MNTSFPLVEFIDNDNGQVDYARSYNWSSIDDQSGSAVQTTEFTLPPGLVPKTYLVKVIASGITSAPVTFSFVSPTSLSLCPGESGSLSVITAPQPATYQWLFNGTPLLNQTNAQLNFVVATTNQFGPLQPQSEERERHLHQFARAGFRRRLGDFPAARREFRPALSAKPLVGPRPGQGSA